MADIEITQHDDELDASITDIYKPYSEEERQEGIINKSNASHVFAPEFIPFYPAVKKQFDLSDTEALLYGFIRFYLTNSSSKFYFTNEQLSEMLLVSGKTVSLAMSKLSELKIVKTGYKMKAGGGTVRFVSNPD
jgi:hypothetical protein